MIHAGFEAMKQSSDGSDHNPFDIFNNLFGNSPFFNRFSTTTKTKKITK